MLGTGRLWVEGRGRYAIHQGRSFGVVARVVAAYLSVVPTTIVSNRYSTPSTPRTPCPRSRTSATSPGGSLGMLPGVVARIDLHVKRIKPPVRGEVAPAARVRGREL